MIACAGSPGIPRESIQCYTGLSDELFKASIRKLYLAEVIESALNGGYEITDLGTAVLDTVKKRQNSEA
jgi:predicted transcriptional regulator